MRKLLFALVLVAAAAGLVFWWLTQPVTIAAANLPASAGDPEKGAYVFTAAGCASCHAAPKAKGEDKLRLAGGLAFKTNFGTFYAPNISPHPEDGIGGWSTAAFINAVQLGVSPDGDHYYPAFPFNAYQHMTLADAIDLKAYMDGLPVVAGKAPEHDLPFAFRWRRGIGLWKRLYMKKSAPPLTESSPSLERGAYLVNALSHCGECHTPRNFFGGLELNFAFSGGPEPDGEGTVPNITPHEDGIGDWSERDIVSALKTGILPDFETFGGSMIAVQENMAKLTESDQAAIASYLKALPPKPSRWKKKP